MLTTACMLFNNTVMVRVRFSFWLVNGYADSLILLSVVVVTLPRAPFPVRPSSPCRFAKPFPFPKNPATGLGWIENLPNGNLSRNMEAAATLCPSVWLRTCHIPAYGSEVLSLESKS